METQDEACLKLIPQAEGLHINNERTDLIKKQCLMSPSLFSSKVPFESLAPGFMQGLSLSVKGLEESLGVVSARSLALSLSLF